MDIGLNPRVELFTAYFNGSSLMSQISTASGTQSFHPSLPPGIRSRKLDNGNGLTMHILEAGFEQPGRECVLLLHGFPELAFTWRKVMLPLAAAGYHVVAPDQRGYGLTEGADLRFNGELSQYHLLNLVRDALGLVFALGHGSVAAVVGHDIGSPVAATCALTRPDVFRSVALMSAPYPGVPAPSRRPECMRIWQGLPRRVCTTSGISARRRPMTTC
jgi:pimeloyl-ACP methyl ester carboxylesterase